MHGKQSIPFTFPEVQPPRVVCLGVALGVGFSGTE